MTRSPSQATVTILCKADITAQGFNITNPFKCIFQARNHGKALGILDCNVIPSVTGHPDHDCHGTGVGSIGLGLFQSLWHWHWHWQSDSKSGSQALAVTGSLLSRLPRSLAA
jgi:hypothetical protein